MTTPAASDQVPDHLDRQIIRFLRDDPRLSYEEISHRLGFSRTTVRTRVHHLLDSKTLRITGVPHPRTQGLTTAAELLVDTTLSVEETIAPLADRPYLRAGHADGLVTVSLWCRDDAELTDLAERLRAHHATCSVEVFRVTHLLQPKFVAPSALDEEHVRLDEQDRVLMVLLASAPRARYAQLSEQIGLSPAATRARVLRLLNTGALRFEVTGHSTIPAQTHRIGIIVQAPASAVALGLLRLPGLTRLALGHGRHDILAHAVAPPDRQHALYRRIRNTPGVGEVRFWLTDCEVDLPALLDHDEP